MEDLPALVGGEQRPAAVVRRLARQRRGELVVAGISVLIGSKLTGSSTAVNTRSNDGSVWRMVSRTTVITSLERPSGRFVSSLPA